MFFFDPTYLIFMIPAFLLMALSSWYVKSAYNKWSKVRARSGLTGAQAAQRLIQSASYTTIEGGQGLRDVRIMGIGGNLTDNYDPRDKTLKLSPGVANTPSVASIAVAAHELGHAMQDSEGYFPMRLRSAFVPAVNIGSNLGWILIIGGLFLYSWTNGAAWSIQLAWMGVIAFSASAVFALLTLPVEFNASSRAKRLLVESGIIQGEDEERGVSNVLNAAALTYVAGLITAVLQLLYYVMLVSGLGGRRRS
jgi:Zn-dependent membrane protease YugP